MSDLNFAGVTPHFTGKSLRVRALEPLKPPDIANFGEIVATLKTDFSLVKDYFYFWFEAFESYPSGVPKDLSNSAFAKRVRSDRRFFFWKTNILLNLSALGFCH